MRDIASQCQAAFEASRFVKALSGQQRAQFVEALADQLLEDQAQVLQANAVDRNAGKTQGLSEALIDRLTLTSDRLLGMHRDTRRVAALQDPLGIVRAGWTLPNGLQIRQVSVPLGVVAMIYEARPNVTIDAIALCIKSGNAVVLRGSASVYHTNTALVASAKQVLRKLGLDPEAVQLIEDLSHEGVSTLVQQRRTVQVAIPRGGAALIQRVVMDATVPTIETGVGNCHIFVDDTADQTQALAIILNAKTQRPSVCNAVETVLIHRQLAPEFLPKLVTALTQQSVVLKGCPEVRALCPEVLPATDEDWDTEYLNSTLAIKIVSDVQDAVAHIRAHGTQHSEAILSQNMAHVDRFIQDVDAAAVLVNASTRFVDGSGFGFGAEIGISTQKLHARGPMGLEALTTTVSIVQGHGQIRP